MLYRLSLPIAVLLTFLSFNGDYTRVSAASSSIAPRVSKLRDSPLENSNLVNDSYSIAQATTPEETNQSDSKTLPPWIWGGLAVTTLIVSFLIWLTWPAKQQKKSELPNPQPKKNLTADTDKQEEKKAIEKATESSLPVQATTRLPNIDLVNSLILDLQESDPKKRRKAIWELAQKADSRAVKPLVDLMLDADSQERVLILEALSQVCGKSLKPMHHALALSLQDENAQVRKNAIRDVTRLYDLLSQVRPLLYHATADEDREVREVAKWALDQLNLWQMPPETPLIRQNHPEEYPKPPSNDAFNL